MTRKPSSALPLILALFVGLGVGAVWRAGATADEHRSEGHVDQADDPAGTGATDHMDMGHMDMDDMDMDDMDMDDMDMDDMAPGADEVSYAINLANDTCPVMGGETDGTVYTHWNGLRVQFCCSGCEKGFLADPEGSLREAGVDPTVALAAIAELRAAQGEQRTILFEELSSQFQVVEVEREGKAQ